MSAIDLRADTPAIKSPTCRLLPSVLVTLGLLAILLAASSSLLNDPDSLWHVEVGRQIWADKAVPRTDVFSHSFAGAPWMAKEWISQLIFYAAHQVGGWSSVVMISALAIAVTFGLLHAWLAQRIRWSLALGATMLAIVLAAPTFLARPHALVLPVLLAWTLALVGAADRRAVPSLAWVPLMALWANMHGSFPLGLLMAGVLACEGVLSQPPNARLTSAWRWGVFLAASLLATCVSPYGWHAILVPLQMPGNAETLRFVSEWQPIGFDTNGFLALALMASILGVLAMAPRQNLFRIVAVGLLAYLMVRHVRFVTLFALLAPALAARALSLRFPPEVDDATAPRAAFLGLLGVMAAAVLVQAALAHPFPNPKVAPEAAYRFALTRGVSGPVYNDYDFGGYLMARGTKTFVDGRTDQLFLGNFLPDLDKALASPSNEAFAAILARYKIRWALVRSGSRDAAHLASMRGWSKLYQDDVAAVFAADQGPAGAPCAPNEIADRQCPASGAGSSSLPPPRAS